MPTRRQLHGGRFGRVSVPDAGEGPCLRRRGGACFLYPDGTLISARDRFTAAARKPAMRSTSADQQSATAPDADYVGWARELGPELETAAEEIERRRELPEPIVEALVGRGLFRLLLPRSLGGAELPPAVYVQVIEEVAKHDASTAWCLGQACGSSMVAAFLNP